MFLLRAAIEHRGASSSKLLRSSPSSSSRPLACASSSYGDRARLLLGIVGEAATSSREDGRAFSSSTSNNLVRRRLSSSSGSCACSPSAPRSTRSKNLHHHLRLRRSFAADAARSLDKKPTKVVPIPLAQTGEGLKEVEIVSWRVAAGDRVEEFGPLCNVQSDKAAVEITSRFSGVVEKLCCSEGDVVEVGATLCELRVEAEEEEKKARKTEEQPPGPKTLLRPGRRRLPRRRLQLLPFLPPIQSPWRPLPSAESPGSSGSPTCLRSGARGPEAGC